MENQELKRFATAYAEGIVNVKSFSEKKDMWNDLFVQRFADIYLEQYLEYFNSRLEHAETPEKLSKHKKLIAAGEDFTHAILVEQVTDPSVIQTVSNFYWVGIALEMARRGFYPDEIGLQTEEITEKIESIDWADITSALEKYQNMFERQIDGYVQEDSFPEWFLKITGVGVRLIEHYLKNTDYDIKPEILNTVFMIGVMIMKCEEELCKDR